MEPQQAGPLQRTIAEPQQAGPLQRTIAKVLQALRFWS